jgi:energy-coupling factor transporter ATP-binding protein EcfA2
MTRLTRAEIEESLLRGNLVSWSDGTKRETLQLSTAAQRLVFKYVLESPVRLVKGLSATFIEGLKQAFEGTDDPGAISLSGVPPAATAGPWRLHRIESSGFGGINTWGGPPFSYDLDGESLIVDGPNGSGKSSFIGALTWAMRGERAREAGSDGPPHDHATVYDLRGVKTGAWPPLACYPDNVGDLLGSPAVQVRLTFKTPAGQQAALERTLINGRVTLTVDPQLALPPVLIETGLMMPARLAQIRWGTGDQQLTDAVQMLTGLDEVATLGDFVGDLCHKGRDFLNYSRAQRRDEFQGQFDDAMNKATASLSSIGRTTTQYKPSDTRAIDGSFAALLTELGQKATEAVAIVGADLHPSLDLKSAAVQQQVAAAIEGAKGDVSEGLLGIPVWTTTSAVRQTFDEGMAKALEDAIATAKSSLLEASELKRKASQDSRFQLKALGASWHEEHATGDVENCPLCQKSVRDLPELALEITSLRKAGAAAKREYEDNVNAISATLLLQIPATIRRHNDTILELNLPTTLTDQLKSRFIDGRHYGSCLAGVADLVRTALERAPKLALNEPPVLVAGDSSTGTESLIRAVQICERYLAIAGWHAVAGPLWTDWWQELTTVGASGAAGGILTEKIAKLEDAIRAWTPYAEATASLEKAWDLGVTIDQIDAEQEMREKVSAALEPLKALRKLAEHETRSAIEGLSHRMAKFLDEIYVSEKLKFHSAHFDKKAGVTVRGGFDAHLLIDAALVANSSWIRALLWAFLFSLREEGVELLGADRLPLLVLDDPQSTFDTTHRHRWIQRIAGLQAGSAGLQIVLTTHDEPFLDQLSTLGVGGRRAHLSAAGQDIGHLHIVDGTSVSRAWNSAQTLKTPEAGRAYMERIRVYVEAMLKVMLRGESETRTLTLGKLRERIDTLNRNKVTPWNRPVFRDLVGMLSGPPEIKHIESAHHTTGALLGMAEAEDVEKFWRRKLSPQMEHAFLQIREYRLLHGESKALFASTEIVQMPAGHGDVLKSTPLTLVGRASALTSGRVADGALSALDLSLPSGDNVVLGNHDAFRLVTATLEPVARPGDILLVAGHGTSPVGSLVVATCGGVVLARRFQVSEEHPDVAVLVAQAITPSSIAPPFIAHTSTVILRKIVGVLFDSTTYPVPDTIGFEVTDCGGDAPLQAKLRSAAGLVVVSGDSAEPIALNGQFLIVGTACSAEDACRELDGRPVLATDSDGNQYFKRLRSVSTDTVFLESLQGGVTFLPSCLQCQGMAVSVWSEPFRYWVFYSSATSTTCRNSRLLLCMHLSIQYGSLNGPPRIRHVPPWPGRKP